MSRMKGSGRSFSDMSGGGGCRVGKECSRVVVWDGVVQICWGVFFLYVCGVGEACDGIVVGNGGVLPSGMRLVFVRKPACSHVCCSGVVWIECSLFERCSLGLSSLVSP